MSATRFAILGSGIAGLSAAEAIRERDSGASVTVVSEEAHPFYSRPGLAYFLRRDIPEDRLFLRTPADLRQLNATRITARVERLDPVEHALTLADGRTLTYDRLLLATGALAVPPPFPGGDLDGVVKLDGLDDARHILAVARRARDAVVVGGGITALELAEGLHARGLRVRYFLRGEKYWSDVLDDDESRLILNRLRHDGIRIQPKTQVQRAVGVNGRLVAVETQAGERVPCQLLAVAIGVRPRADLARAAGLAVGKGIVVDPCLQTSADDVFAAGDVAESRDPLTGAATLDVLWPTALAQGRIAGANLTGERRPYLKTIAYNVTMLAGLKATIIGAVGGGKSEDLVSIVRGESETWRAAPSAWVFRDHDAANRIRVVLGERTILGALVLGDPTWARPLQQLILARADIAPIRDALSGGTADALTQLGCFYADWQAARR